MTSILLAVLGLILLVLGLRALGRQQAKRMVAEFRERFPGRCIICSYHRYGVQNGYTAGPPDPHDCIEAETQADGNDRP